MPKLISEIKNPALRKMAEDRRSEASNDWRREYWDDLPDELIIAFEWNKTAEGWAFWDLVYCDDPALLSHPLYPKEETEPKFKSEDWIISPDSIHPIKYKTVEGIGLDDSWRLATVEEIEKHLTKEETKEEVCYTTANMDRNVIDSGLLPPESKIELKIAENVTRIEVIDLSKNNLEPGRTLVKYLADDEVLKFSFQDNNKTLKIFIQNNETANR